MFCSIDCSEIANAQELHLTIARYLKFPHWYGHNLDALYDCLTDLPQDTWLYLSHWDSSAPWAAGFESVFEDAARDCPSLTVYFERA